MENEKCKHCGALLSEKAKFCFECGTLIAGNKQDEDKPVIASLKDGEVSESKTDTSIKNDQLMNTPSVLKNDPYVTPPPSDSKYAYMSIWGYVGMMILFSLPVIGFILAIIWACASKNINRRNYARAVLVLLAITIILSVVISVVGFLLLYDDIMELYHSFQQNGYTVPFEKYDIQIDSLINKINNKNGAYTYRYIGDIIAF